MTTVLTTRWAAGPRLTVSPRTRALLALLVATALWGTSFIAAKGVLAGLPPITVAFLRFAVALLVLLPILVRTGRRPVWGREAALLGLTGVALLFVCQNLGLRRTGAAEACLIMGGGYPIFAALLARAALGERLTRRILAGLLTSVGGVVAVVLLAGASVGGSLIGNVLLLGSAASGAAYTVVGRRTFAAHDLAAVLAGSTAYGLLFLLPAAVGEVAMVGIDLPVGSDLLLLLYLGAGCSGLAYLLWGFSLRHLTATESAVVGNLEIVVGLAAAAVVVQEPLAGAQLGGGALILGGAWLATSPSAAKRSFRPCAVLRKDALAPRAA